MGLRSGGISRGGVKASWAAALLCALALAGAPGCQLLGYTMTTLERTGSHDVSAEYEGLVDKRVAIVVDADKLIQANFPRLVAELTASVAARLSTESNITMVMIPPAKILRYQLDNPRWAAKPYDELGAALGADRLIIIDLYEFRLHEPGNQWVWSGIAAARVGVVEADGPVPEEFIYTNDLSVDFPDLQGTGPEQYSAAQIAAVLRKRIVDRIIWLFFEHEEKNMMDY